MFYARKSLFILILFLFIMIDMHAQKVIKLWDGNPPAGNGITESETYDPQSGWIENVTIPTLTIFSPQKDNNNRMAVVICPGGGYAGLAFDHEGTEFAQWLNTLGITGIVLKYRMPNGHKHIPLADAQQAIRYVREHSKELGIDVNKVGIAGFSAGGHLAATASTHYSGSGINIRPDFSILFYPVITMEDTTHGGSKLRLLGEKPSKSDIHVFSNEKQVNKNTPPAILLLNDDDGSVPPANSISYYNSLKKNDIPATIYIFPEGGHGRGMNKDFKYHDQMLQLLKMWLEDMPEEL